MEHSHLNDMEILETKRFIPKGFELGTTLGPFIRDKTSRGLHKTRTSRINETKSTFTAFSSRGLSWRGSLYSYKEFLSCIMYAAARVSRGLISLV